MEELKALTASTADVDVSQKEGYLSDADFQAAFEMDKDAFKKLAKWKQTKLKKKVGLF